MSAKAEKINGASIDAEKIDNTRSIIETTIVMSDLLKIDLVQIRNGISKEIDRREKEKLEKNRPPKGWQGRAF